jgi:hypothetical protein
MKKIISFFCLLIFFICANAQKNSESKNPSTKPYTYNGWYVKGNFLGLLDTGTPTFQIGTEKRFNHNWAIEISLGIPVKLRNELLNTDSTFSQYYKLKGELKFYTKKCPSCYVALGVFYIYNKYKRYYEGFYRNGTYYYSKYSVVSKLIPGISLKYGMFSISSKKYGVGIDFATGLGLRFRYTKINATDTIAAFPEPRRIGPPLKEGFLITPHVLFELQAAIKI